MQEQHQDLLYSLHDKPNAVACLTAALQHMLASFIGVITPTLIISATLGLTEHTAYLICMALFVSGVGTFIQTKKIWASRQWLSGHSGHQLCIYQCVAIGWHEGKK